jgi:hypothetical protein
MVRVRVVLCTEGTSVAGWEGATLADKLIG